MSDLIGTAECKRRYVSTACAEVKIEIQKQKLDGKALRQWGNRKLGEGSVLACVGIEVSSGSELPLLFTVIY